MFAGKTIAVTGATGALGQCLLRRFVAEKAVLAAWDRELGALEANARSLRQQGAEIQNYACDLSGSLQEISTWIEQVPSLNAWIHAAGLTAIGAFPDQSPEQWRTVFQVNFSSIVEITRSLVRKMEQQGHGQIVFVASVAGVVPAPWMTAYTASKHALVGFCRSLQEELRQRHSPIEVLLVTPGFFESPIIHSKQASFPEWLRPILGSADGVADEILNAMRRHRKEATPTLNGKILKQLFKACPRWVTRSSRVLLTRGPLDLILNRYEVPRS